MKNHFLKPDLDFFVSFYLNLLARSSVCPLGIIAEKLLAHNVCFPVFLWVFRAVFPCGAVR